MTSVPDPTGSTPPPPPPPQRPRKYRPSAAWFVAGIVLILIAIVLAVVLPALVLVGFIDSDATVRADGEPHHVSVDTDGDRMLWLADEDATCRVLDATSGDEIPLRTIKDGPERSESGDDVVGVYRFSPGSGDLEVTCTPEAGTDPDDDIALIGSVPEVETFAVAILVAIGIPALLGFIGLVMLIWTGILWSLRPARPKGT